MQVLLYDDKEMHVFDVVGYYPCEPLIEPVDITTIEQVHMKRAIFQDWKYKTEIAVEKVKAELDPTTMKRIAKYNLETDFWEINDKINKAREELARLDKEMNIRREKIAFLDNLVEKIWEDEDFEEENYFPDDEEDE